MNNHVVVISTVVGIFLLTTAIQISIRWRGKRRSANRLQHMADPVDGVLHVTGVDDPAPYSAVRATCAFEGVVQAPGVAARAEQVSGMVDTARWPRAGDDLPITVDRANPKQWLIRWERVPSRGDEGLAEAQEQAARLNAGAAGTPPAADWPQPSPGAGPEPDWYGRRPPD
jgi:hypothetical protein